MSNEKLIDTLKEIDNQLSLAGDRMIRPDLRNHAFTCATEQLQALLAELAKPKDGET